MTRHIKVKDGANSVSATVTVQDPKLWWPSGYGKQPLYDLKVTLGGQTQEKKIGLRSLELINENDTIGTSMTFRVNGVDVFCKGANWIPMDARPETYTENRYRGLLEDALAANMNMIRVWGGGQYEKDCFYEICDELGLLVWQDLMFACALSSVFVIMLASQSGVAITKSPAPSAGMRYHKTTAKPT
jgi:beta-mannosidase